MRTGSVYIVGAGPGDPRLLTVEGARALAEADAVVYDRLLSPRLLNLAPVDAEYIFAGKESDVHALPQEGIHTLLVRLAREGKTVVRLKGGDPFVFGRGGEEAQALREAGIPFVVVSGVSSALAVPAAAGIPVTHRGFAQGFSVWTGHLSDPDAQVDLPPAANDTVVVLMGVSQLPSIVAQLARQGRRPDTPVAIIRYGTTAAQETLVGTLGDIVERAKTARMRAPAVIVVGDVVNLRRSVAWKECHPLFGKRVVVSAQTTETAARMAREAEALGAEAFDFALERYLAPGAGADTLAEALLAGKTVRFAGALGVKCVFERLHASGADLRALYFARIGAADSAAEGALRAYGVNPDFIGRRYASDMWVERPHATGSDVFVMREGRRSPVYTLRLDRAWPLVAWAREWHGGAVGAVRADSHQAGAALYKALPELCEADWPRETVGAVQRG